MQCARRGPFTAGPHDAVWAAFGPRLLEIWSRFRRPPCEQWEDGWRSGTCTGRAMGTWG